MPFGGEDGIESGQQPSDRLWLPGDGYHQEVQQSFG